VITETAASKQQSSKPLTQFVTNAAKLAWQSGTAHTAKEKPMLRMRWVCASDHIVQIVALFGKFFGSPMITRMQQDTAMTNAMNIASA
jgi:hypothetical protein